MSDPANPVFVFHKLVKNSATEPPTKDGKLSSKIILIRSDYFLGFLDQRNYNTKRYLFRNRVCFNHN